MDAGVILDRNFEEWEWFTDSDMVKLFIFLLIRANSEDKKLEGITVKRGQFMTSYSLMSEGTNFSVQKLRTCIGKLKNSDEITFESTSKFTIITICNYERYKQKKEESNKPTTSQQQANNKQATCKSTNKIDSLTDYVSDACEVEDEESNMQINKQEDDLKEEREVYKEKEEKERTKEREEKEINQEKEETLPPKSQKIHEYKNSLLSEIADQFSELDYQHIEIAKAFQTLFRTNLISAGASPKIADNMKGTSIDDIRLIIEADGYTVDDLRQVFDVLRTNDFWKKNVISTKTLRKQMTRLKLEKHGDDKRTGKTGANRDFHELAAIIHAVTADGDGNGD